MKIAQIMVAGMSMALLAGCSSQSSPSDERARCLYAYVQAYRPGWRTDDTYTLPECKKLSGSDRATLRTEWESFLQKLPRS